MCLPDRGEQDLAVPETFEAVPQHTDIETLHGSKYAWGQVLADRLDMNCVNRGVVGASVKETLWHFDQTLSVIKSNDIVCFLWPYAYRYNLIQEDDIKAGRVWPDSVSAKKWYQIFDPYDSAFTTQAYMQYTHLLLKEMNVQSFHMFVDIGVERLNFYTDINVITDTDFNTVRNLNDLTGVKLGSKIDKHGGVQTHKVIANMFYQQLITRVGANDSYIK